MDRFPALRVAWESLSPVVRAGLVASGLDAPEVFRNAWDGSPEEGAEIAVACGGVVDEVGALQALWVLSERPAVIAVTRKSNFHASEATTAVELARGHRDLTTSAAPIHDSPHLYTHHRTR